MNQDFDFEFYFGPVPVDAFDDEIYFLSEQGRRYFYKIVMDRDLFYIHDTCGRMMPVDREFVGGMGTAMFGVSQLYKADTDASKLFERKYQEISQLMLHFTEEDAQ